MAAFFWIAGDGTWSTAANWTANAVPGSSDDAFISAPGGYTVSITSPISVGSVTISDAQAVLAINDAGVTQSVTGGFSNAAAAANGRNPAMESSRPPGRSMDTPEEK